MGDISISNGNCINGNGQRKSCWYEEEIEENLRWCFALNGILHTGATQFQDIQLLDTKPFGKALVIDGKLQSAEIDEFIYHESLVHPALLNHLNPKTIFIMGGGEGSTAREILRHRPVEKVVMCDIDEEVVEFCKSYLVVNREAFSDPRLELIFNDARAELERREEFYDVIIGDLADPIEGGPCYQLYTKSFYEFIVKPRLNQGGIFVTQAGPAGIFSHTEVFSCIYNTLRQVFKYVVPYSAHIPSYADTWGWVMVYTLNSIFQVHIQYAVIDKTEQFNKKDFRFFYPFYCYHILPTKYIIPQLVWFYEEGMEPNVNP
ncbi:thermospermine synthase ACAULIS5-like [Olea europaea subsp. europaea]|uniref:thermospermine synthase n=1 Tax=Olea europaea subsp. europaea TaxID=158383 RepID=A0A8S0R9V1_OLEEU|nr:thermospermine synthase ACAULIS5-like [Olea europaea subsp. europaea]